MARVTALTFREQACLMCIAWILMWDCEIMVSKINLLI